MYFMWFNEEKTWKLSVVNLVTKREREKKNKETEKKEREREKKIDREKRERERKRKGGRSGTNITLRMISNSYFLA